MIRFIRTFELPLIRQFRERWGEQYTHRVQAHWSECIRRFQSGTVAEGPADELLLRLETISEPWSSRPKSFLGNELVRTPRVVTANLSPGRL
jgi:hypothetical protein